MHRLALCATLGFAGAAAPPTGDAVAAMSNIAWIDANWASDGTGAMPIGNGDVASSVWVDEATGDLRLLVSKSDVFDENSQPVKTGVLRVTFDPPLWSGAPAPAPKPACKDIGAYTLHGGTKTSSIICDQHAEITVPMTPCSKGGAQCAAQAAQACCADARCVAFSLNPEWKGGIVAEFCASTALPDTPGPGWATWTLTGVAPPAPAPGPASTTCPADARFCQTLDLPSATVTIATPTIDVTVAIDLNAPNRGGAPKRDAGLLHIVAKAKQGASPSTFGVTVTLEPYRVEGKRTSLGRGFCYPRYEHADTIVAPANDSVTWYHWNHVNTTYYNDTIADQGLDPAVYAATLADPFTHLAFGGRVAAAGLETTSDRTLASRGATLTEVDIAVTLLTLKVESGAEWLDAIGTVAPHAAAPRGTARNSPEDPATWGAIWKRSYVDVTAANASDAAEVLAARQITDHTNWDRYLSLIQGRASHAPIKFNGQAFNCNNTGKGWDARDWGADYWWQNTRQPYYNVLAQGDFDTMRAFLDFYLRMLPYNEARTKVQFLATDHPITAGAFYEETCTQFGTYNPGDWGCKHPHPAPNGASSNTFIRFHWTGGLELALLVLDYYDATGDDAGFQKYFPMAVAVVEAFRQRFPNTNASTGKIDFFPAQALETYQCPDPTDRNGCPTNPSTDIGGLMSVLPRMVALPAALSFVSAAQRAAWAKHLAALPALPLDSADPTKATYAAAKLAPVASGNWTIRKRHNSENTELYVAHPFRVFGYGKSGLAVAQQTYAERRSPCNSGWCQDIIQAAMLNLTDAAATQLAGRAAAGEAPAFRFPGFAAHDQDYEPSLDDYGFMRTGLNYMLMAPLDDAKRSMVLFPTWPVERWNVRFKLHAPLNTTVEASCQGGQLEYLIVTPASRSSDFTVANCRA